ncbi:MAG: helix-turn-helix domain-containing protein [Candidatus Limnocylindrales bacterium]
MPGAVAGFGGGVEYPVSDRAPTPTRPSPRRAVDSTTGWWPRIDDDLDLPGALVIVREILRSDLPVEERRWLVLDADAVLGLGPASHLGAVRGSEVRVAVPTAIQALVDAGKRRARPGISQRRTTCGERSSRAVGRSQIARPALRSVAAPARILRDAMGNQKRADLRAPDSLRVRRQALYRLAAPVFRRHGYRQATLKQLAAACGMSIPALYRYFPSKRDFALYPLSAANRPDGRVFPACLI